MPINLIIILIMQFIGDFYLQFNLLSKCKEAKMDDTCNPCVECSDKEIFNLKKVLIHVGLYMIPFLFLLIIWNRNYWLLLMIYLILAVSHIIINCFSIFFENQKSFGTNNWSNNPYWCYFGNTKNILFWLFYKPETPRNLAYCIGFIVNHQAFSHFH